MSTLTVRLVPVTPAEYVAFVPEQIREFADQKVRAGHWRPEEAQELSRHAANRSCPFRDRRKGTGSTGRSTSRTGRWAGSGWDRHRFVC